MLALLGLIPGVLNLLTTWAQKRTDAHVAIRTAELAGDKEKAIELVRAEVAAQREATAKLGIVASNRLLTCLVIAFAAPLVIYFNKLVVWDVVLGMGTTDPLRGQAAEWASTIIAFVFGAPTALALGKMVLGR